MKKICVILFACAGCSSPLTYPKELMEPWGLCDIGDASNYTSAKKELLMQQHLEQYRYWVGKEVTFVGAIDELYKYGNTPEDVEYTLYLKYPNWQSRFYIVSNNIPRVKVNINKAEFEMLLGYDKDTVVKVEGEYLRLCYSGVFRPQIFIVGKTIELYGCTDERCALPKKNK